MLSTAVVNAVSEELLWRGVFVEHLRRRCRAGCSVAACGILAVARRRRFLFLKYRPGCVGRPLLAATTTKSSPSGKNWTMMTVRGRPVRRPVAVSSRARRCHSLGARPRVTPYSQQPNPTDLVSMKCSIRARVVDTGSTVLTTRYSVATTQDTRSERHVAVPFDPAGSRPHRMIAIAAAATMTAITFVDERDDATPRIPNGHVVVRVPEVRPGSAGTGSGTVVLMLRPTARGQVTSGPDPTSWGPSIVGPGRVDITCVVDGRPWGCAP